MLIKRNRKKNIIVRCIIVICVFYYALRTMTLVEQNGGSFELEMINIVFDNFLNLFTPVVINQNTLGVAFMVSVFLLMVMESFFLQQKKNIQEDSYGSAEWGRPEDIKSFRDKEFQNNMILTSTEIISRDMKISKRNRNLILLGRPGTGKSRFFFKSNLLNATGSIVITDPKMELLRDCGQSLINQGYTIKILNLFEKWKSNNYNPLMYIKKMPKEAYSVEDLIDSSMEDYEERLAEDDVMTLINTLMVNTKSDMIESNTGDPFWEKAEMIFLQALIYYVLFNYPKVEQNFDSVLKLIRMAEPDDSGNSELDSLFYLWSQKDPDNIGVKQYKHFKVSASSPKMMSTIIMTATARLAPFNISEINKLTNIDNMELNRVGLEGKEGRIAYFIVTKPNDNTFNFIASIFYTQIFTIIDNNANDNNGSLPTPTDLYMEEWAQIGEIPRFVEMLAYVRGLNCGVVIGLQSLSQLKKVYKDSWETVLDCCDYILFLGSRSKETLEYISAMLGKKTWYKKSSGRTFSRQGSSSTNWDVIGRELATIDELARMEKGKCILMVEGLRPFYSSTYTLEKHPRYDELFEPWEAEKTKANYYDHMEYMKKTEYDNEICSLFTSMDLPFVTVNQDLKMRKLMNKELHELEHGVFLSKKNIFSLLDIDDFDQSMQEDTISELLENKI